jgi:hypothetical protein
MTYTFIHNGTLIDGRGVEEVRKKVREILRAEAEVIKIVKDIRGVAS